MRKGQFLDLSGRTFGHWTVLRKAECTHSRKSSFVCRCVCGTEKEINGFSLSCGDTQSCGCQKGALISASKSVHGLSETSEYSIWKGMVNRCTNPKNRSYRRYGGREISVCDRWLNDFTLFLQDMGKRPDGMTLDRKENDGHYCLKNCRWVNRHTQQNNRRVNVRLAWQGMSLTVTEWSRVTGLRPFTISERALASLPMDEVLSPVNLRNGHRLVAHPSMDITAATA